MLMGTTSLVTIVRGMSKQRLYFIVILGFG